jgi:hypothetical protein
VYTGRSCSNRIEKQVEETAVIRRAGPAVPSSGALSGVFLDKSIYYWRFLRLREGNS